MIGLRLYNWPVSTVVNMKCGSNRTSYRHFLPPIFQIKKLKNVPKCEIVYPHIIAQFSPRVALNFSTNKNLKLKIPLIKWKISTSFLVSKNVFQFSSMYRYISKLLLIYSRLLNSNSSVLRVFRSSTVRSKAS